MTAKKKPAEVSDAPGDTTEVLDAETVDTDSDIAPAEVTNQDAGDVTAEREEVESALTELRPGDSGEAVSHLQAVLQVAVTGKYDRATANAVRRYQASTGGHPTGRVDSVTFRALGL